MNKRQYPRQAWVLQTSFKPKEVTIERPYKSWSGAADGDLSSTGKWYSANDLFDTKDAAIAAGHLRLAAQEEKLAKQMAGITKKRAELGKAADGAQGETGGAA